jgi:hypothetical protein
MYKKVATIDAEGKKNQTSRSRQCKFLFHKDQHHNFGELLTLFQGPPDEMPA